MKPMYYKSIDDYECMIINNIKGLFTNYRIERKDLPNEVKALSIREGDDDFFGTLEEKVLVNHMGDFLTCEISDIKDFYMDIEDYSYLEEGTENLKQLLLEKECYKMKKVVLIGEERQINEIIENVKETYEDVEFNENIGQEFLSDEINSCLEQYYYPVGREESLELSSKLLESEDFSQGLNNSINEFLNSILSL